MTISTFTTGGDVKSQLLTEYLNVTLEGSGRKADQVVEKAFDNNLTVNEVYLDIFQNTGYQIGELWQRNQISVAQEHLVTSIIERQMGDLRRLFKPEKEKDRTLVLGSVSKEFHSVGVQMVADFFTQDGWTVYNLGPAVPTDSFLAMARDVNADMIGLSAQMIYHLPTITEFVRDSGNYGLAGIPIIVGGMPFVQHPELYETLDVHLSGTDAADGVRKANQLLEAMGK